MVVWGVDVIASTLDFAARLHLACRELQGGSHMKQTGWMHPPECTECCMDADAGFTGGLAAEDVCLTRLLAQ